MGYSSDFLFARPSFVEGMARVLDFGNTLNEYNSSRSTSEADSRALRADWECVGNAIREAMNSEMGHEAKEEATTR